MTGEFTLGVMKAENGYIVAFWNCAPEEGCFDPGTEEKRYIAASDEELVRILAKLVRGPAAESGPIADHPIRS